MKLRHWPIEIGPLAIDGPHADADATLIFWIDRFGLAVKLPQIWKTHVYTLDKGWKKELE